MSLLFESIEIINGDCPLLSLHTDRCNKSRKELFGVDDEIDLQEYLPENLPENGKWKCRITYDRKIRNTDLTEYRLKSIKSFKIIEADKIDYAYKYADRSELDSLFDNCDADEVIIIKQGLITDTSFSNLAFYDGASWITPEMPLLNGVRRRDLLEKGLIEPGNIHPFSLEQFSKIALINALNDLGEATYPIESIIS